MSILLAVVSIPQAALATDPWETVNRDVFFVNEQLDAAALKPIARSYQSLVPRPAQQGIQNFFSNINDVNVLVNDLLQFRLADAATDTGRLLINSTLGLGGLLDVASRFGLQKNEEDFGQTLASWNVASGPYLVLPIFGPTTLRDSVGLVVDTSLNPLNLVNDSTARLTGYAVDEIDYRARLLPLDELVVGDRYLFLREAYLQRRAYLINDG
ncbi:MAG: VacJ family lipoprotein, partial [Gimesia chilikensis]